MSSPLKNRFKNKNFKPLTSNVYILGNVIQRLVLMIQLIMCKDNCFYFAFESSVKGLLVEMTFPIKILQLFKPEIYRNKLK